MEHSEQPKPSKAKIAYERLMHDRKLARKADSKKPFDGHEDEDEPDDPDLMEFLEELHRPKDKIIIDIITEREFSEELHRPKSKIIIDIITEREFIRQVVLQSDTSISSARKEELLAGIAARKSSQEKLSSEAKIKNIGTATSSVYMSCL